MEKFNLNLFVFGSIFALWSVDILWKSILILVNKKELNFIHENIIISFLGLILSKDNKNGNKDKNYSARYWKMKGIIGIIGGSLFFYMAIDILRSAFW